MEGLYKTEFTNNLTKNMCLLLKQKHYVFLSQGKIRSQIRI